MVDTKEIINCPACKNKMAKIYVKAADLNVDVCNNCGGILFDNREFEKFNTKEKNADEIFEVIKDKNFEPVDDATQRVCGICNTPMARQGAGTAGIKIDVCYNCGAKFLDNGELEKIRNFEHRAEYFSKQNK